MNLPPGASPVGLLIVTENPKLMRPGMRKPFQRHGYRHAGKILRGSDLWVSPFGENRTTSQHFHWPKR